jgi:hypothetical protein
MLYGRATLLVAVVTGFIGLHGGAADAAIGQPIYTDYESGYQVQGLAFQTIQSTFLVPTETGSNTGGLAGVTLTNTGGPEASCGWLGIGTANGEIGCYDEAAPLSHSGWMDLLPSINPGDLVTVSFHYASNGRVTFKATDVTQGTTKSTSFATASGETWNTAFVGLSVSNSAPVPPSQTILATFAAASLTPVGGKATALSKGSWVTLPVIATTDGSASSQVIGSPTTLVQNQIFQVTEP